MVSNSVAWNKKQLKDNDTLLFCYIQDSLHQWSMPINADQDSGIDPNVDQFWSMPIKNLDRLA